MLNSYWLAVPFVLQMICMAADELVFHRKRGLPRWERIGHPLDTLTVLVCLVWVLLAQPGRGTVAAFAAMAVLSCIFVTKDEPVHRRNCTGKEQWLHAVLFMLHPIVLASAALLWPAVAASPAGLPWMVRASGYERVFLVAACLLMLVFAVYQFVFWNLLWRPKAKAR